MKKSEYVLQAEEFARKINLQFSAVYLGHFPRLSEYATSQWQIMLGRPGHKPYSFQFSQSINDSWRYRDEASYSHKVGLPSKLKRESYPKAAGTHHLGHFIITPIKTPPSLYDVLACLTKYDPGSHKDFCADFGYDADSIKARDIYLAVQEEWANVNRLFGDVIEELQEIS